MTLGQRICQYRKQLNISQEELGDRLGVSRQAVSKWETDLSVPDMNNLLALAREFGISVAELTATPEKTDTEEADSVPPLPIQAPVKSLSTWKKVLIAIFVLFILFLAGFLLNPRRNIEQLTAGTAEETTHIADLVKSPTTDFALILDWTKTGDFLQLGEQTGTYPFETPLPQDAKMVVTREDNGAELHTVDCLGEAGIRLTYSHLDGQPDILLKLETAYTKEVSTPRGIHVGSTKAEVVGAYGPDLVYCVKEDESNLLAEHNYFYAYQPKDAYSNSICFFMEDGLVAGIRVENMLDAGNEAYSINNITRFPIQSNGDPDYSNRQDIYQEPIDASRRVYIAWNQLVTNENLSAEERYAYRNQMFYSLRDMDWTAFGMLGSTDEDSTKMAFINWLANLDSYSSSEILDIQMGCTASGLDGAYSEGYDAVLCSALFYDPVTYAKMLAYPNVMDGETRWNAITGAVFYGELFPEKEADAAEALDAVIGTNALMTEENAWAKLLRYYLTTPSNDRGFGDYPKTPAELESLQNG